MERPGMAALLFLIAFHITMSILKKVLVELRYLLWWYHSSIARFTPLNQRR